MNDHRQIDIFGKKCAKIVGHNENGRPILELDNTMTIYAATVLTHPNLKAVLKKYSESADGSFNILIEVRWQLIPDDKKEIYLLRMCSENMEKLISMMDEDMKKGQWTYKLIVKGDLKEDDIVYDQNEFLNLLCQNYFRFEFIRDRRWLYPRTNNVILTGSWHHSIKPHSQGK